MFLSPVEDNEIKNIIRSFKVNKAPGPDQITTTILKEILDDISKPLVYLINLIFTEGYCPLLFKQAIIVPVYKSGGKEEISNYRPISLTSYISKIFENCIKNRILQFLNKNNILNDMQFGFQAEKSTEDALNAVNLLN